MLIGPSSICLLLSLMKTRICFGFVALNVCNGLPKIFYDNTFFLITILFRKFDQNCHNKFKNSKKKLKISRKSNT